MIPDPKAEGRRSTPEAFRRRVARPGRAGHPRSDPLRHPARRPRLQARCGRSLARSTCCRAFTARPCSSAARPRRWSRSRWARRRDEQRVDGLVEEYTQEVHARLLLPAVLGGRSAGRSAARAAARSATGPWPSGASSPCCPTPDRLPLHDPHHLRHPRIERLQFDGQRLRRHAGPDGRRRADQQSGGRHLRRPGQGGRPLGPA